MTPTVKSSLLLLLLFLLLLLLPCPSNSTVITGAVTLGNGNGNYVSFLARFGVPSGQEVFVFGSSERVGDSLIGFQSEMTLAFLPEDIWRNFSRQTRSLPDNSLWCNSIMNDALGASRTTADCRNGTQDLLRTVPCGQERCGNQPKEEEPIAGSKLTYRVTSPKTQFYYLVLVGCTRNSNATSASPEACVWSASTKVNINYSISITNSDPDTEAIDPFVYQFPYQSSGLLITAMTFLSAYFSLLFFHIVMHCAPCNPRGCKMHRLTAIFTISLVLEVVHVFVDTLHWSLFAHNGVGAEGLRYVGEFVDVCSDWLFILVLLLIGKGWQLTTCSLRWRKLTFSIWGTYILFSGVYFIWTVVQAEVYPYSTWTTESHQSWAGAFDLTYRALLFFYILYELRQVYLIENRRLSLNIYRCLIVFYIVWFWYLPLIVVIAVGVNPVRRHATILTTSLAFDLVANCIMVLLLCPRWAGIYFQFDSQINEYSQIRYTPGEKLLRTYGSYTSPHLLTVPSPSPSLSSSHHYGDFSIIKGFPKEEEEEEEEEEVEKEEEEEVEKKEEKKEEVEVTGESQEQYQEL